MPTGEINNEATKIFSSLGLGQNSNAVNNSEYNANKDDFLKLILWQMQHQDPLEPKDGGELLQQLVQIHTVKSTQESNNIMNEMSKELKQIKEILQNNNPKGKREVATNNIKLTTKGNKPQAVVGYLNMPMINDKNIDDVNIQIINPRNNTVVDNIRLGPQLQGAKVDFKWDAIDSKSKKRLVDNMGKLLNDGDYNIVANAVVDNRNYNLLPVILQNDKYDQVLPRRK